MRPALLFATLCLAAVGGCKEKSIVAESKGGKKLTPAEYFDASPEDKLRYKTVTIYVPELFGRGDLPPDPGPWKSVIDRAVRDAYTDVFTYELNRSLFELKHPEVAVEPLPFDMWSADFRTVLATSLASDHGPSMYIARNLPDTMYEGLYADITDLLADWPAARNHKLTRAGGSFGGRIYCVPGIEQAVAIINYRKDYFREAGIFNEFGEPGPPTNWSWRDFREYARRLTRDIKRADRSEHLWGFMGEQYRFDMLYVACNRVPLYVPDRTGRYTWRLNWDDPRLADALRNAREMRTVDQSVRAGGNFNWAIKAQEFEAGRVAMVFALSSHPADYYIHKPWAFGGDVDARQIMGMALLPTDDYGVREYRCEANMYGFNPTYTREQLRASIAWFRSWVCGDINANFLSMKRQYNEALGLADPYPQYSLVKAYESEVGFPPHRGAEVFPPDFRRVYDTFNKVELAPRPIEFGLKEPIQLSDAMNSVYTEALFSDRKVEDILRDSAEKINHTCMNFKVENDREKLRQYYTAYLGYARRTMPPPAIKALEEFIETRCKVW